MMYFVRRSLGFVFVSVALFFACSHRELTPDGYVLLGANESVNLNQDITVRADSIFDSRCPEGWQCLVAGSARVVLSFTRNNVSVPARLTNVPLYTKEKGYVRQDSTTIQLSNQRITIIFNDIVPHRSASDSRPPNQKAVIQVSLL